MQGKYAFAVIRSTLTALAAALAAVAVSLVASFTAGIQLLTSTLLVMGGNDNPAGLTPTMQQELGGDPWFPAPNTDIFKPVGTFGDGYIDTENNTSSPFYGWDFTRVVWPADISLKVPYEPSQQQGVHNIDWAIYQTLPTLGSGEKAVAFGYSSSANVMVREMRALQNQPGGAPATDQLEFFLMGSPNRPNGGIMQRFPGLYIPFLDIRLDGSTPVDTPYPTTDVSWQYDGAADFPLYPVNLLADINVLLGSWLLHGNYFPADMNGQRAFPDTTVGNITYITLKPSRLPLLLPLSYLKFPEPLLDLVEPALTVMVEWGYDRSISPGTPTTARLIPRVNPIKAIGDLAGAVVEGVQDFCDDLKPTAATAATDRAVVAAAAAVLAKPRTPRIAAAAAVDSPAPPTPKRQRPGRAEHAEARSHAAKTPRSAAAEGPSRKVRERPSAA
jgi:hypothetical protein